MPPELLTTGEFNRAMDRLHERFDRSDRRVDYCVAEVASIKTLVNERAPKDKKETRNTSVGWSTAVASGIVVAFEAIKLAIGK
jgi:hypothetical protein